MVHARYMRRKVNAKAWRYFQKIYQKSDTGEEKERLQFRLPFIIFVIVFCLLFIVYYFKINKEFEWLIFIHVIINCHLWTWYIHILPITKNALICIYIYIYIIFHLKVPTGEKFLTCAARSLTLLQGGPSRPTKKTDLPFCTFE